MPFMGFIRVMVRFCPFNLQNLETVLKKHGGPIGPQGKTIGTRHDMLQPLFRHASI